MEDQSKKLGLGTPHAPQTRISAASCSDRPSEYLSRDFMARSSVCVSAILVGDGLQRMGLVLLRSHSLFFGFLGPVLPKSPMGRAIRRHSSLAGGSRTDRIDGTYP